MPTMPMIDQVRLVMEDVFDLDQLVITEATSAQDIEEWDSLSHIRLIVTLERRLKIKFKNSEVEEMMNVGDLIRVIERKTR